LISDYCIGIILSLIIFLLFVPGPGECMPPLFVEIIWTIEEWIEKRREKRNA